MVNTFLKPGQASWDSFLQGFFHRGNGLWMHKVLRG